MTRPGLSEWEAWGGGWGYYKILQGHEQFRSKQWVGRFVMVLQGVFGDWEQKG